MEATLQNADHTDFRMQVGDLAGAKNQLLVPSRIKPLPRIISARR